MSAWAVAEAVQVDLFAVDGHAGRCGNAKTDAAGGGVEHFHPDRSGDYHALARGAGQYEHGIQREGAGPAFRRPGRPALGSTAAAVRSGRRRARAPRAQRITPGPVRGRAVGRQGWGSCSKARATRSGWT